MKRRLLLMLLLLVGGAIVNVAVAWGSAGWVESLAGFEKFSEAKTSDGDDAWRIYYGDCLAGTVMSCEPLKHLPPQRPRPDASNEEVIKYAHARERWEQGEVQTRSWKIPIVAAPYWSHASSPPPDINDRIDWYEDARGWPARALKRAQVVTRDRLKPSTAKSADHLWSIELTAVKDRFGESRRLPMHVIWPGFAINTVFYAVILWLLFAGPFVLRRRRRIRRGLCPKCAYDLRGTRGGPDATACPECGALPMSAPPEHADE